MTISAPAPAEILIADDDEDHVHFTRLAFARAKVSANLHHVDDGRKCLDFLRRRPPYEAAPTPAIVLLDIEMPVMDGRQVLAAIVDDARLKHLPVIVMTSRAEDEEVTRMYRLRCNSYLCKLADFDKYVAMVKRFADYWLSTARLPSGTSAESD